MSDNSETKEPRPARGVRIALIVSLALNLLVIGAVAGLVFVGIDRSSDAGNRQLRSLGLGPILSVLSQEDRRALNDRVRTERARLGQSGAVIGRAVQDFATALRAEPFDREMADAALSSQREHGARLQSEGHVLLLDHIETMSAEERDALAERIEASLQRAMDRRSEREED